MCVCVCVCVVFFESDETRIVVFVGLHAVCLIKF